MSIIRTKHNAQNPFVALHKSCLEDPNLSFKAKGLWAYLISRPDNWKVNVKHLSHVSKEGEDAIYSALNELIEEGYCERYQTNQKGRFGTMEYLVYEVKIKKFLPQPGFPDTENPHAENQEAVSQEPSIIYNNKERDIIKNEENKRASASPPIFQKNNVKMKKELYEKLIQQYGTSKIEEYIQRLDEYAEMKPKKFKEYGCHATVIRNWITRDEKSKTPSSEDNSHKDKQLALQIEEKFKKNSNIQVGYNYIEFIRGPMNYDKIKFGENGFRDRCLNNLRKMNLDSSQL